MTRAEITSRPSALTIENPIAKSSLQKFWDYCSINNGRRYGKFEKSGKVINFYYNRFFKNISSNGEDSEDIQKDATASTREAFYFGYDKNVSSQNSRDDAIAKELPDGKDSKFRAKRIKYGNHNAMWEILSGHLYRLTGLEAPDTRMVICEKYDEEKIPDIYVASPLVTGYHDLGDFLVNETVITAFLAEKDLEKWKEAQQKIQLINAKSGSLEGITAEDKINRLKAMEEIYLLLPSYVHEEVEKSFAASKFIHNWDFANLNLNNIGVKFTFNKDRKVTSFKSVFVDFGNSGAIGFGGKYKELSLEKANSEAKKKSEKPLDYDPSLAFNEAELNLILEKELEITGHSSSAQSTAQKVRRQAIQLISQELVEKEATLSETEKSLRRSIIFKDTHHIREQEAGLEIDKLTGFLTFSDLPRNLPFSFLLKPALKEKNKSLSSPEIAYDSIPAYLKDPNTKPSLNLSEKIFRDSEIEMAFRLSLISDTAIERVVRDWYLFEEFPEIFSATRATTDDTKTSEEASAISEEIISRHQTSDQIIEIFKERRNILVNSVPQKIIDDWIAKNPFQAIAAQEEVSLAILRETHLPDQDFEIKHPFTEESSDSLPKKVATPSFTRSANLITNHFQDSLATSEFSFSSSVEDEETFAASNSWQHNYNISPQNSFLETIKRRSFYADKTAILEEIKKEIDEKKNIEKKLLKDGDETLRSYSKILETLQNRTSERHFLENLISEKETEHEQFATSITIKFISENIENWQKLLELDSKPNCNFFDVERLRQIYRTQNYDDLSIRSDQLLSSEKNKERNARIHQENCFVYDNFISNLQLLSVTKTPKAVISSNNTSQLQQLQRRNSI